MIEKICYYKTTPKYIMIYKPFIINLKATRILSIYINRKTREVKKEMKQVFTKDIDTFFSRVKKIEDLEDGTNILAQTMLLDPELVALIYG